MPEDTFRGDDNGYACMTVEGGGGEECTGHGRTMPAGPCRRRWWRR